MTNIVEENNQAKYVGDWNICILVPRGLSATAASSSVYAIITWLGSECQAKLYDLKVAQSPDDVWSVALEERIYDEL